MENLTLFYRILNEDLSPLFQISTKDKYVSFLKDHNLECTRRLEITLIKKNGKYSCEQYEELHTNNVLGRSLSSFRRSGIDSSILDFLEKEFKIDPTSIVGHTISKEHQNIYLELLLKDDYDKLPAKKSRHLYYQALLEEAVNGIRKKLNEEVFKLNSEGEIRLYIKNYQALISAYMKTTLRSFIPHEHWNSLYQLSGEFTVTDIFKVVYQSLEEIMVHLERSFNHYLDVSQAIPYQSRLLMTIEYTEKLGEVLQHLESASLDPKLHELVLSPFDDLGKMEPLSFSYRDQFYHEAYLMAFHHALKEKARINQKRVIIILWRLNYNSPKFSGFLTASIAQELKGKPSAEGKMELLYYYQKLCNQIVTEPGCCFNPELPGLKNQMNQWLQEEISYLKRKIKRRNEESPQPKNKKGLLKLSVAQLSLITRLFFESGLVEGSRKDLLRFVANHYRTNNQEQISVDSLSSKYYQVETGTKKTVSQMMKKMLAAIENVEA